MVRGIEDGDLTFEFIDAAVDERAAGEDGGVVIQVTRGESVGAVDSDVVGGKDGEGVGGGDAFGMRDDVDERIGGAKTAGGGDDLEFTERGVVMEELALEIVGLDAVEVGDAERADPGGGEVEGGGAAEAAGADDENPGGGEFLLAGDADLTEENVPAVAREFVG